MSEAAALEVHDGLLPVEAVALADCARMLAEPLCRSIAERHTQLLSVQEVLRQSLVILRKAVRLHSLPPSHPLVAEVEVRPARIPDGTADLAAAAAAILPLADLETHRIRLRIRARTAEMRRRA